MHGGGLIKKYYKSIGYYGVLASVIVCFILLSAAVGVNIYPYLEIYVRKDDIIKILKLMYKLILFSDELQIGGSIFAGVVLSLYILYFYYTILYLYLLYLYLYYTILYLYLLYLYLYYTILYLYPARPPSTSGWLDTVWQQIGATPPCTKFHSKIFPVA